MSAAQLTDYLCIEYVSLCVFVFVRVHVGVCTYLSIQLCVCMFVFASMPRWVCVCVLVCVCECVRQSGKVIPLIGMTDGQGVAQLFLCATSAATREGCVSVQRPCSPLIPLTAAALF